jgi:hypothetical protein
MLEKARPYFSDSSEWKVQLSADLRLEYSLVAAEPMTKSYTTDVTELKASEFPSGRADSMYLRIVSAKLTPGKKDEFVRICHREIISGLRQVEGCLDAYLAEGVRGNNELLSITIWRGLGHARAYEATGGRYATATDVKLTATRLRLIFAFSYAV